MLVSMATGRITKIIKMGTSTNDADNSAPTWMNNEFFEEALRSQDPSVTVTSSKVTRATAAGDNYCSDIYRVTLKISKGGQTEERSVIMKCSKYEGKFGEFFIKTKVFDKEINMFTILFPEMNRLLGDISTSESQQFTAKYIYSNTDERGTTILLEDLKTQGFKLAELKSGLDMKHCLLVIGKIAKFHAASVVLYHKDPDRFETFMSSNMYTKEHTEELKSFFDVVQYCLAAFEEWPEYKTRFAEKLSKFNKNPFDDWVQLVKRDDSEFNVLAHGDMWVNNLMFRYSEETGEVEDVRFVDFQLSNWTSPGVDLQHFLNSSASPEVLENVEVLKHEYYRILAKTLADLGCAHLLPTEKQFSDQFEKKSQLGVLSSLTVRTFVFTDRKNVPDIDKLMNKEGGVHLSKMYLDGLKKLLPIYEKNGWI